MHFGWEKYELLQDTSPGKVLAAMLLLKLNGQSIDEGRLRMLAAEVLDIPVDATSDMMSDQVLEQMVDKFVAAKSTIDPDEPGFLLRGLDPLAPEAIEYWITKAKLKGVSADRIKSAEAQLAVMRQYGVLHTEA